MVGLIPAISVLFVLIWHVPAAASTSLPHLEADVLFDPDAATVSANVSWTVQSSSTLRFRLAKWIQIDDVSSRGRALTPTQDQGGWRVDLPDGSDKILFRLSGIVPRLPPAQERRGVRGAVAGGPEGSFLPGYSAWLPDIGAYWVTYRLVVTTRGGQTAVATG